ncbi:hypothetical protein CHLRE_07g321750v5 [Chlamydomonas reinhardtii]|uniref:Uncharacterized protein n=2 Tax=Chlamydomonas reinhardtii TaxID=3055 RepID=A0A2K3DJ36_CHLRE|nr:uncharacterized protein CHLRE_07g321750v5 [Chlamydomonas reinhardtii]PNW80540.1 hypothetical protein CHLRE_07g321750v5 [Chlamydomonas reinhardtii]
MTATGSLVLLDAPQLKRLATVVHRQEMIRIKHQKQPDDHTFKKLCADSRAARDKLIRALDDAQCAYDELAKSNDEADARRKKIAEDHFWYLKNSFNNAIQNVRNFIIRDEYVSAVEAHSKEVLENLFNVTKMADTDYVETLAKGCYQARESALEAARRAMRPTARHYSEWLKETGIGFDDLVNRSQVKLNKTGYPAPEAVGEPVMVGEGTFGGEFSDLTELQKIMVYEDVMEESGVTVSKITAKVNFMGAAGMAVILLAVGLLAWDVYQSAHPLETAVRGAFDATIGLLGAMGGESAAAIIATGVLAEGESTALFIAMASFAGGIAGAFIVGALVAVIVGAILGSGGKNVPLTVEGMKACLIELPDGRALARQIQAYSG